jgi:Homeodomain-like domain
MRKQHHVRLTIDERQQLESLIRTGKAPARTQTHARILLKADCSEAGPAWTDDAIVAACEVSRATVERVRRAFARQGPAAALHRKRHNRLPQRKLDGRQEAQLVALTCSAPPQGQERWTLALLADKLIELKVVDSIARETVRSTLKKTNSSRG